MAQSTYNNIQLRREIHLMRILIQNTSFRYYHVSLRIQSAQQKLFYISPPPHAINLALNWLGDRILSLFCMDPGPLIADLLDFIFASGLVLQMVHHYLPTLPYLTLLYLTLIKLQPVLLLLLLLLLFIYSQFLPPSLSLFSSFSQTLLSLSPLLSLFCLCFEGLYVT